MDWRDEGIVIGARRHGEAGVVLDLLTREHGRHLGFVPGGRSRRLQPVLQAGNTVAVVWRARLDDQLGTFAVEPLVQRAARFFHLPLALYALSNAAALLLLLPERDPHPALFDTLTILADHLDEPGIVPALTVRFELAMLAELGFGIDLSSCAATGVTGDLAYVSPKSSRAVSREAGAPYQDRLLALPSFLLRTNAAAEPTPDDVAAGFALTGFFLERHVFSPRGLTLPDARTRLVMLANSPGSSSA